MTQPIISIITACYTANRLGDLKGLLDSVNQQTFKNIEVLIVAERSRKLANSIQNYLSERSYTCMQVLFNNGPPGICRSRNLAIGRAQGGIIGFADDDAILDHDWAEETLRTYDEDDTIIGVAGPILPLWQDKPLDWFPQEFYWIFSCLDMDVVEKTEVRNGYGTNLSFLREAFESAGLFSENLGVKGRAQEGWQEPGAEEPELSLRVREKTGKRIIYNPMVRVQHRVYSYRNNNRFIARRAFWEGYAKAMLKHRHHFSQSQEKVLTTEYALLRRILFGLIPKIGMSLFSQPLRALRQSRVTIITLASVAAGFLSYKLNLSARRGRTE
ncbi:glycosyltransferase family 2 protein [Chloroflexota bacterium]